jgi:hypothetical protein
MFEHIPFLIRLTLKIGAMKPGDMITSKIALENVVEDGIKQLIHNKEKHVKILVQI